MILIERGYSDIVRFQVALPTANVAQVKTLLASRRAVEASYIGHPDFAEVIVSGYLIDFDLTLDNHHQSSLTINIESVTHGTLP